MLRFFLACALFIFIANADEFDAFMDGFDEQPVPQKLSQPKEEKFSVQEYGIEGELKQELVYSYRNDTPHDKVSSFRSTLFLELNQDIYKSFKFRANGNAFYDWSYLLKGENKFTQEEKDALQSQVELFDLYLQGTLFNNLDVKIGRQVVVWGKSDTIRVVDIINPLDNRRPAMVDIEELRLSTTMAKFDYYYENWSITPIFILEQRKDKLPPFGGDFNPSPVKTAVRDKPNEVTYALNISGEFTGFDLDFYFANVYPNFDFYPRQDINIENKILMYGAAAAYVVESWLFKSELAYNQNYKYIRLPGQTFDRLDVLVGAEYKGIADTTISLDMSDKYFVKDYGMRQHNYQGAFRITSDFLHATLHANYTVSAFGEKLDEGGYQRGWIDYDVTDSIKTTVGFVDYLGGNTFFDTINDNDMFFGNISYSF